MILAPARPSRRPIFTNLDARTLLRARRRAPAPEPAALPPPPDALPPDRETGRGHQQRTPPHAARPLAARASPRPARGRGGRGRASRPLRADRVADDRVPLRPPRRPLHDRRGPRTARR